MLKPSSVGKNNVNTRDSKTARRARAEENSAWSFLKNVARDLCACQRLVNFWDGDVVILQISGMHLSLMLRFQVTSRFSSARARRAAFESRVLTLFFPTDEGLSTSRSVLKEHQKTSQCQTIILQC